MRGQGTARDELGGVPQQVPEADGQAAQGDRHAVLQVVEGVQAVQLVLPDGGDQSGVHPVLLSSLGDAPVILGGEVAFEHAPMVADWRGFLVTRRA